MNKVDLNIKSFKYHNKIFEISIEKFDKLTNAPIKIVNHNTNNIRLFEFDSENELVKIFKCNDLLLIIKKYE